jgi:hypothetical protein
VSSGQAVGVTTGAAPLMASYTKQATTAKYDQQYLEQVINHNCHNDDDSAKRC